MTGPRPLERLSRCALLAVALGLAGCGSLLRNCVPVDMMATAVIPGMPEVRAPAGRQSAFMARSDQRRRQHRAR